MSDKKTTVDVLHTAAVTLITALLIFCFTAWVLQACWNEGFVRAGIGKPIDYLTSCWVTCFLFLCKFIYFSGNSIGSKTE